MPEIIKISLAALVGFTVGMLYKWLQIMYYNGYLAYREFFNSWVKIIPRTATHEDIENVTRLIAQYFEQKQAERKLP